MSHHYHVYILSSVSGVLFVGVTNSLLHRMQQHRSHAIPGFTARYRVTPLVHCEETIDVQAAIAREKQIKAWSRSKKLALIESSNPTWRDLAAEWFGADGRG
jgi:putative endonuclease